jgi:hypothetical protein
MIFIVYVWRDGLKAVPYESLLIPYESLLVPTRGRTAVGDGL